MIDAVRELWEWTRQHAGVLFLATVAAYAQQHYDLHGPPAHLQVLPSLAVATFLVLPLWAAILYDTRDRLAMALATLGMGMGMAPALVWGYAPNGEKMLKADATMLVAGATLGLVAVVVAAARGRVSLADWGLGFGDVRWWSRPVGILLAMILVGIPIVAWIFPEFVAFYPRYKPGRTDVVPLLQYQVAMGIYMFCWEFLFRGFMLFGLARFVGPFASILIQCYPFFILHHNKPEPEMASSWFGGLLVGWLCWRSKSMWPSFLLHWIMYSTMEITAFVLRNLD